MPCGGISKYTDIPPGRCWTCGKDGATHFIEEWDAHIHVDCIVEFLGTEEGKIVIEHGHTVVMWFEDHIKIEKKEN